MLHFQSNVLIRARIDVRAEIARQLPPFLLVGSLVNLAMAATKAVAAGQKIKASALATEHSGTVDPSSLKPNEKEILEEISLCRNFISILLPVAIKINLSCFLAFLHCSCATPISDEPSPKCWHSSPAPPTNTRPTPRPTQPMLFRVHRQDIDSLDYYPIYFISVPKHCV